MHTFFSSFFRSFDFQLTSCKRAAIVLVHQSYVKHLSSLGLEENCLRDKDAQLPWIASCMPDLRSVVSYFALDFSLFICLE